MACILYLFENIKLISRYRLRKLKILPAELHHGKIAVTSNLAIC